MPGALRVRASWTCRHVDGLPFATLRCDPPSGCAEITRFKRLAPCCEGRIRRLEATRDEQLDAMTTWLAKEARGHAERERTLTSTTERARDGRKKLRDDCALIHVALKVDIDLVGELLCDIGITHDDIEAKARDRPRIAAAIELIGTKPNNLIQWTQRT